MKQRQPVTNKVEVPHTPYTQEELNARRDEQAKHRGVGFRGFLAGVAIGAVGVVGMIVGFREIADREINHQDALREQTAPLVDATQQTASAPRVVHPDGEQQ